MSTIRIEGAKPPHCPVCKCLLNGASSADPDSDAVPEEGDFSLCLYCGAIMRFTADLEFRVVDDGEAMRYLTALQYALIKQGQLHVRSRIKQ